MYGARRYKKRYPGRAMIRRRPLFKRTYRRSYVPRAFPRAGMAGISLEPVARELKFLDNNAATVALAVGGGFIFSSLNVIPQGAAEDERIGVKVTLRTVQISGSLLQVDSGSAGQTTNRVRLLLVWDKQNSGGSGANLNEVINPVVDGMRDVANMARFVVLKSWLITTVSMSGGGDGTTNAFGETQKPFKFYKKCSIPIHYDAATGGITEQTSNNIFFAAWMESANPQVLLTAQFRVRYSDA